MGLSLSLLKKENTLGNFEKNNVDNYKLKI